jgi:hypothetical protein
MSNNRVIERPLHSWNKPKWANLLIKLRMKKKNNQVKNINSLIIASFKLLINVLVGTVLDFDIV